MASNSAGFFQRTKRRLLRNGQLFEDADFPANNISIGMNPPLRNVVWKRPMQILRDQQSFLQPLFIRDGATRADFDQGRLGDCWFIAASACLAVTSKDLLNDVIQPEGQAQTFRAGDYAGIFRFRFWRYGNWVEVIIDDRLPTVGGKLVFAHNMEEPNEFWAALMEKAYAKIHGSYDSLVGGYERDAMVDFTGGISETYTLDETVPPNIYEIMLKAVGSHCMMSSSILAEQRERAPSNPNGLYKGHAYSITAVTEIQTMDRRRHRLVRLRNPWGRKEWNGDWSDRSPRWNTVDQRTLRELKFERLDDGEFWMSYYDWVNNFDQLDMCYLSVEAMMNPHPFDMSKTKWKMDQRVGQWVRGVSAGWFGRAPHQALYDMNPRYRVELTNRNRGTDRLCTMVVSLMQVDRRQNTDIAIGVKIYEDDGRRSPRMVGESGTHAYRREVTAHFTGEPGRYIIVPSKNKPDKEASFLLRIFTE